MTELADAATNINRKQTIAGENMRITIVTKSLAAGGAERVIAQLLNEWSANDVECSLILLSKTQPFYTISEKVIVHEIGKVSDNPILNKFKQYQRVRMLVKDTSPDVVLSLPEEIGIYVIGALFGTRIPVVVSERNNPWVMPNKKTTRFLRKVLYPFATGLIFQTKQAASFFSTKLQRKGAVLANPLDLSRIPESCEGEREKIIVGAGRLEKQKNFHLLIDAFAEFYKKHTDYKLVIYGDGSLRDELENHARSKLPGSTFSFPGKANDLLERMNKASAFVLSSDFEGVPNVLIEAMASGVPSVSTDCAPGGAAELIENGKNGFLVPVGDAKLLSERISEIVENESLSKAFSKESVKIKVQLDAHLVCAQWLEYLKIVKEKQGM